MLGKCPYVYLTQTTTSELRTLQYLTYLFFSTLLMSEVVLRMMDYEPGVFQSFDGFQPVDSLFEYHNYTTDDFGSYMFGPWVTDSVPKYYRPPARFPVSDNFTDYVTEPSIIAGINWEADHLNRILTEYARLWLALSDPDGTPGSSGHDSLRYHTPLPSLVRELLARDSPWTPLDSLIVRYVRYPFNSDGFRSIEFTHFEHTAPRILLVGDSFTYGESASPIYNSFADLLLGKGYAVYNAGISGTDPAQYMSIVQKYVPKLKPDIVIIAFCLHNDMMRTFRDPAPDRPHEYITNAGFYYSNPHSTHLNIQEAYDFYEGLCLIPQESLFNRLCAMTAVTTRLWGVLHYLGVVRHPKLHMLLEGWSGESTDRVQITSRYMDEVADVCRTNGVPLLLVPIPDVNKQEDLTPDKPYRINNPQIDSFLVRYPHMFPTDFYRPDFADGEDIHFNNQGSRKFAAFLDSLTQSAVLSQRIE